MLRPGWLFIMYPSFQVVEVWMRAKVISVEPDPIPGTWSVFFESYE
jgi:hypothetical protein